MKKILNLVPEYGKYSETFIWKHISDIENEFEFVNKVIVSKCSETKIKCNDDSVMVISGKDSNLVNKLAFKFKSNFYCPTFFDKRKLLEVVRAYDPDIIHAHFGYFVGDLLEIINMRNDRKFFISFHGTDLNVFISKKPKIINAMRLLLTDKRVFFIFPSEFLKQVAMRLVGHNCHIDNLIVVYNPVSINFINVWEYIGRFSNGNLNLLSTGRIEKVKGFDYVIRSIPILLKSGINVNYRIIGHGGELKNLKKLVRKLKVDSHVLFLGVKKQDEIVEEIKKTDIYIQPSVTLYNGQEESFGVSALEAAVRGVPVIVSDSGGLKSVIDPHNPNHYCIKQRDEREIASTVRSIFIKKPCKHLDYFYLEKFNGKNVMMKWLELYGK